MKQIAICNVHVFAKIFLKISGLLVCVLTMQPPYNFPTSRVYSHQNAAMFCLST